MKNLKSLATILPCMFICANLSAQKADTLKVPESFRSPVGQFRSGAGVAVDTLDLPGGRVSIILKDDHSWIYVKNLAIISQDPVFMEGWDTDHVHAFTDVNPASLPSSVMLELVDSVSRFACPYQGAVFSKFGWRRRRKHLGTDVPLRTGQPVASAFDGRVRVAKYVSGYGNLIVIRHENGLETYYGHLSKLGRKVGEWVHAGDIIGLGGSTGRSTGPHLHFEARYKGQPFDPEWLIDFENGLLRSDKFLLKKSYLNPSVRYSEAALRKSQEEFGEVKPVESVKDSSKVNQLAEDVVKLVQDSTPPAQEPVQLKPKEKTPAAISGGEFHTMRSGETVGQVSRNYGISLDKIRQLNPGVNIDRVYAGQKIRISATESKPVAAPAASAPTASDAKTTPSQEFHVVKSGDTVSAIAHKYGLSIAAIQKLNPGMDIDRLSLGQKIRISQPKDAVSAPAALAPAAKTAPTAQQTQSGSEIQYHTVKRGDTISSISRRYGISIQRIKSLNPTLNVDRIGEGQKIRVQ